MYRSLVAIVATYLLAFSAPTQADDLVRIGVIDLESETVPSAELRVLSDRLRVELVNTGGFQVLERERMDLILREQGFQQSGCVATECVVEIGQLLGAEKMIGGRVGKVGDVYTMTLRMVDVETGALERSAVRDCECALQDILTGIVAQVAAELAGLAWTQPLEVGEGVGMLFVESTPAGGQIFIDGRPRSETTPATLRDVSAGEHIVRVVREDLVAEERVRVQRDDLAKVSMPLQRPTGSLFIESDPPGADVRIDGTPRGTTPTLIRGLAGGAHAIGVFADGYVPWEEDIVVEYNQRAEIPVTLQPVGYLTLTVRPADARVWLDGREIRRIPRSGLPVGVGDHRVVARKADHDSAAADVTIEHGRISSVRLELPYSLARLVVRSTPPGAMLSSSPQGIVGTTPYRNQRVEPGTYRIHLALQDRVPWAETVEIGRGETRILVARLGFTQEYLQRAETERQIAAARKRAAVKRGVRWLSFGAAVIAGGLAYKYNSDAQSAFDEAADVHSRYRGATTTADADTWRAQFEDANSRGDTAVSTRNALYAAGGALFALGVTLWVF